MNAKWILIRYGEIALKSDYVRKKFEHRLMDNIRAGLSEEGVEAEVKRGYGRVFVKTEDTKKASDVLRRVFGIVSFSPCVKIESDFERIAEEASRIGGDTIEEGDSFAVRARRTGRHSFTSKDIEIEVGSRTIDRTGAEVDLDNPDKEVFVEVRQGQCYIFTEKIDGPGGMPLGTQGKVLSLLKGDCNSFLATWLMMKRGCSVVILHANMDPYMDEFGFKTSLEELEKWSYGSEPDVIKFDMGDILFSIQKEGKRELACLLCKRFLLKVAEGIASERSCKALVSGEPYSRSFDEFRMEDSAVDMPVLRPLVGFTDSEVEKKCRKMAGDSLPGEGKCDVKDRFSEDVSEEDVVSLERELDLENVDEKIEEVLENENT